MSRILLSAVLFLSLALGAQASTVRIDVTGSASGHIFGSIIGGSVPTQWTNWNLSIETAASDPANMASLRGNGEAAGNALDFVRATSGSMLFDGQRASACSGLLIPVCWTEQQRLIWTPGTDTFTFMAGVYYGGFHLNERTLFYGDDDFRPITLGGVVYTGPTGMPLTATFTTTSVSVVPLPAPAVLLLAGLGALAALRRGRARRT
jgi:hypothetical protein